MTWGRRTLYKAGGNVNYHRYFENQSGGFSKNQNYDLPYDPDVPLGIYPRISIPYFRDTCTSMFIAALFTIGRKQNKMRYIYSIETVGK